MERVKGIEPIREHQSVSAETGVIMHVSTSNTKRLLASTKRKYVFAKQVCHTNDLSPAVVSRSHAANRMQPTKAQRNHRPQAAEAGVGSRPSAWWSARLVRPWSVPQGCQQGARRPPTP